MSWRAGGETILMFSWKIAPRNALNVSYNRRRCNTTFGKMPEWLNGTVSKTVVGLVSTEGSNPSLPAK